MVYAFVRIHVDTSLTVDPQTSVGVNFLFGVLDENRTHIPSATNLCPNHWTTNTISHHLLGKTVPKPSARRSFRQLQHSLEVFNLFEAIKVDPSGRKL